MSVRILAKICVQPVIALLFIIVFITLPFDRIAAYNIKQSITTEVDTILIASEPGYPPFCSVDKDGNADGFSVDLIKAVSEVMHLNIQIKVGNWAEIKQELVEGKIDALPMVGRSPEREEVYDFTFPYHTMNGAIFVRNGTKDIVTLNDLKQKDIAVMKGDNAHEFVTRVKLSGKIHTTETYDIAFRQLAEGKYDAVIAQELMGLQLLQELDLNNIIVLDIDLKGFSQDFSFAVKEGDRELLALLNEGLSIIIANGTYNELHKKWWTPITLSGLSHKEKFTMLLPYFVSFTFIIAIIAIVVLEIRVKKRTRKLRKEITERKLVEEELKINQERLKIANSILRHDISNDLVVVKSAASIYRKGRDESMIDEIERRVQKSLNTITGYRSCESFLDSNTGLDELELIDVINSIAVDYPKIKFTIDGEGKVFGDDALYSIFDNLVSNSIKHGKASQIDINISENNDMCRMEFADNGIGIPDNIKSKVFQEGFFYGESGHTGIGLHIVKNTLERYGGNISVEDNKPKGVIFVINLKEVNRERNQLQID